MNKFFDEKALIKVISRIKEATKKWSGIFFMIKILYLAISISLVIKYLKEIREMDIVSNIE
jgi:hypothetical protein